MPADVETFDMMQRGVLEAMTTEQLDQQLARAAKMREAVNDYESLIYSVLNAKAGGQ